MNRKLLEGFMMIKDLTVEELATQMGMSTPALYKRMQGVVDFRLSEIKQIQKILDLNTTDVVQIFLF